MLENGGEPKTIDMIDQVSYSVVKDANTHETNKNPPPQAYMMPRSV